VAILQTCPSCGFVSDEVRCPRCNALKVIGCSGSCSACKSAASGACSLPLEPAEKPARSREVDATAEARKSPRD